MFYDGWGCASAPPHPPVGTFSPAKSAGEKGSRLEGCGIARMRYLRLLEARHALPPPQALLHRLDLAADEVDLREKLLDLVGHGAAVGLAGAMRFALGGQ